MAEVETGSQVACQGEKKKSFCPHTCASLSLSHPEPMMKATSWPSSNQPSDSSGHWPRKLSTSSRFRGHSPDTDTKAEGRQERRGRSGNVQKNQKQNKENPLSGGTEVLNNNVNTVFIAILTMGGGGDSGNIVIFY